jgi:uroporphyrin-III C-methyltransferase
VKGTVYLVGAGPGAADLLTLRAAKLLEQADVVFHDALVPREIRSLIARGQRIEVGKRSGRYATAQTFINKQLADAAGKHKVVVRLKGGDPMLFGRTHEEIAFLRRRGVPVEVVPGVTAALAASAELGLSLTRRGLSRSVVFVTPRTGEGEPENHWIEAALAADTAGIYMGAGQAARIASALMAAGKSPATPLVVIENASLPERRAYAGTLAGLERTAARSSGGPVLILLGEVYRDAAASPIIEPCRAPSSFSPTALATMSGRSRSAGS